MRDDALTFFPRARTIIYRVSLWDASEVGVAVRMYFFCVFAPKDATASRLIYGDNVLNEVFWDSVFDC